MDALCKPLWTPCARLAHALVHALMNALCTLFWTPCARPYERLVHAWPAQGYLRVFLWTPCERLVNATARNTTIQKISCERLVNALWTRWGFLCVLMNALWTPCERLVHALCTPLWTPCARPYERLVNALRTPCGGSGGCLQDLRKNNFQKMKLCAMSHNQRETARICSYSLFREMSAILFLVFFCVF